MEKFPGTDADWVGASRYEIRTNLPGTQHDTIVADGIQVLLSLQYVAEKIGTGAHKYYRITEQGRDWYRRMGNDFLDYARKVRKG